MRILLINWQDRLNPQAGGAETHLHEIFGRLAAGGHAVTLLASGWPGAAPRERVDGMEVHRVGSRYTFGVAAPLHHRAALRDEPFDVVVEALNKVPVFAPLWARRPTVLLVHHLFGTTAFREASLPLAAMTWALERPLGAVYRGVPAEAISHGTADDLAARGLRREDVRVIHPGVDLGFFTPVDGARAGEPTFLYLGRLKRYKGIDVLLEAAALVRAGGVRVRVVVAGKGDHEEALRALARRLGLGDDVVSFAGFVTEEGKRDLLRRAWANVFPSPKEGWGITSLEAAACGTPTLASDSPGLRESVVHGRTGLLVPHGDAAALAAAMRELAASPRRVAELGAGALDFSRDFSWERAAAATEEHLRAVVACGGAPRRAIHPRT